MEKMKKLLCISLILFAFACTSDPQKEMEKAIVGEWCNPYTYQSTGELKGFNFKRENRSIDHRFFMFGCARGESSSSLFVLEFKGYQRTC